MDVADKRQIVSLIPPAEINIQTGDVSIQMNSATRVMKANAYKK
jgi:hypothetical protein